MKWLRFSVDQSSRSGNNDVLLIISDPKFSSTAEKTRAVYGHPHVPTTERRKYRFPLQPSTHAVAESVIPLLTPICGEAAGRAPVVVTCGEYVLPGSAAPFLAIPPPPRGIPGCPFSGGRSSNR